MAILILDDEKPIRHILRRVLEKEHTVDEAESVDGARRKMAETDVDLVLYDIHLAGGSGLELVRAIPAEGTNVAVVMTGIDDPEVAGEAFDLGVYGYLVKPFTPIADRAARDRVEKAIENLDLTIHRIRTAIFDIESPAAQAGDTPEVRVHGLVDSQTSPAGIDGVLASLRALASVLRPLPAQGVEVDVDADPTEIVLCIPEDGLDAEHAAQMRSNVERLGGAVPVERRSATVTQLELRIPVPPPRS